MRRIFVLEDDADLRHLLCQVLLLGGASGCVPLASYAELRAREAEALASDLALIDINLGPDVPSGIDAYRWLRERDFAGEIVFLTGHARAHPLVRQAVEIPGVRLLDKPVASETLMALVRSDP
jgi:DNA-binding response OmpR family regulator